MITSGIGAMIDAAHESIRLDIVAAIEWLDNIASEKGAPLSKTDLAKLDAGQTAYLEKLTKVALHRGWGDEAVWRKRKISCSTHTARASMRSCAPCTDAGRRSLSTNSMGAQKS